MALEYFLIVEKHAKIMDALAINGKLTRDEVVRLTGYPRSTVYDNLVRLEKKGLVERAPFNNFKRGRPKVFWNLKEAE